VEKGQEYKEKMEKEKQEEETYKAYLLMMEKK
jgi:hypothetical protein